jgi:parallel beta-helix repeat protein
MKMIIKKPMLLLFVITLSFMSCNNEELFVDDIVEVVEDTPIDPDNPPVEDTNSGTTDTSAPCDFTLDAVQAGDTVIINCVLDLGGATVNLPSNVTIVFEGGDIINGTLNFSDNSIISGELLNPSLTLGGSTPLMKDTSFQFDPKRWGIEEGIVTDEIALNNRNILQDLIDQTKLMGIEVFEIHNMDAFFYTSNGSDIFLPSNFHLKLSEKTFIRMQPHHFWNGVLISVFEKENVIISGGHFYGDRFTHDYSPIQDGDGIWRNTHEWSVLIVVSGSQNVILDGVYISDSTGDAFVTGGAGHRYNAETLYNKNIIARNCTFTKSRRNNVSITDGEYITIENCIISEAGNGSVAYDSNGIQIISSAGVAPRVGIDIEPFRGVEDDGTIIDYEYVDHVLIKNCEFTNNNVASIIDYAGHNVIIEGNTSDHGFFASYGTGTQFINNTLNASDKNRANAGITTGTWIITVNGISTEMSENSVVNGNIISGFAKGIITQGKNGEVLNNTISDYEYGIEVRDTDNFIFKNNTAQSERVNWSLGLSIGDAFAKNLYFENETYISPRKAIQLWNVNNQVKYENYTLTFNNCTFESKEGYSLYIYNTPNVEISNSKLINTGILLENAINFKEFNNVYY